MEGCTWQDGRWMPLVTVVMALGMRMPLSYPRIENSVPGTRGGGRGKGGRCRVLSMVATNGSNGGLLMGYCYILLLKNPLKPPEFLVLHPHLMMLFGTEILSIIWILHILVRHHEIPQVLVIFTPRRGKLPPSWPYSSWCGRQAVATFGMSEMTRLRDFWTSIYWIDEHIDIYTMNEHDANNVQIDFDDFGIFHGGRWFGKTSGKLQFVRKRKLRFPVTGKNLRSPSIYVDTNQGCVNPSFVAYAYLDFSNPHDWMGDDKNMHESVGGVVLPWPCDHENLWCAWWSKMALGFMMWLIFWIIYDNLTYVSGPFISDTQGNDHLMTHIWHRMTGFMASHI